MSKNNIEKEAAGMADAILRLSEEIEKTIRACSADDAESSALRCSLCLGRIDVLGKKVERLKGEAIQTGCGQATILMLEQYKGVLEMEAKTITGMKETLETAGKAKDMQKEQQSMAIKLVAAIAELKRKSGKS